MSKMEKILIFGSGIVVGVVTTLAAVYKVRRDMDMETKKLRDDLGAMADRFTNVDHMQRFRDNTKDIGKKYTEKDYYNNCIDALKYADFGPDEGEIVPFKPNDVIDPVTIGKLIDKHADTLIENDSKLELENESFAMKPSGDEDTEDSPDEDDDYHDEEEEEFEDDKGFKEYRKFVDEPFIIPQESFGDIYAYDLYGYIYYADGILADENDEIVEAWETLIGTEALEYLDKNEEDVVYVRNMPLERDYEITADLRTYTEVLEDRPLSWR